MSTVIVGSARRRLSGKRAETVQRLTAATIVVLRTIGYDELTLPAVAAEAGVARATAYTYFSSKDHLIAEAYWRRLLTEPPTESRSKVPHRRVSAVLRHLALIVAGEPALARAITLAMNSPDPDVDQLRFEIGAFIQHLIAEAVGADDDDETVLLLTLIYTGAMVRAGLGGVSYDAVADQLEKAAKRLMG